MDTNKIGTLEHAESRLAHYRIVRDNTAIDTPEYKKFSLLCRFYRRRIEHLKGVYHPAFSY